jgi:hypothetical protein
MIIHREKENIYSTYNISKNKTITTKIIVITVITKKKMNICKKIIILKWLAAVLY